MAGFSIKEKIDQNITIWLLGTLLTGFLSGIGAYRAVQDMAGLKTVSAVDLDASKRQRAELEEKLQASEARTLSTATQLRQAYWAVPGTRVAIVYVERDSQVAVGIKERLDQVGGHVTLRALDRRDPERAGKLYYEPGGRDAAMQIKALVSDIAALHPEDNVTLQPGSVALWLESK
jgi:hypothetical protein